MALAAFAIAASVSWVLPFKPQIHDEFSHLLAADTLLHGRLANPTPEVWEPFQSFHILLSPAYVSKYPLGQGFVVAVGWALFGQPIAGCWIAAAVCAASITWMLGGVTSRRWAMVGGLLVACHPVMQSMWSQSLLSGWLTAAGSSLLAGGVLRLRRRDQALAAGACGVGIALLALTRPFEGLVATCLAAVLLWGLWRGRSLRAKVVSVLRAAPAASLPIAIALGVMGWQNHAVSGHWGEMPYQLHEQQYAVSPVFVFGQPRTPSLDATPSVPDVVHNFHHGWALEGFRKRPGVQGWLAGIAQACSITVSFWLMLALVPGLAASYWGQYRLPRLVFLAAVAQILCSAAVCWILPHYLAPLLPWLVLLSVIGLRRIFRLFVRSKWVRVGRPHRFVLPILIAQFLLLVATAAGMHRAPDRAWAVQRASIAADLEQRAGKHLVLVKYSPSHNLHEEWVYNLADLENGKVLWARGEREDWNHRLIAHYARSRTIWLLEPDQTRPSIKMLRSPDVDLASAL